MRHDRKKDPSKDENVAEAEEDKETVLKTAILGTVPYPRNGDGVLLRSPK